MAIAVGEYWVPPEGLRDLDVLGKEYSLPVWSTYDAHGAAGGPYTSPA